MAFFQNKNINLLNIQKIIIITTTLIGFIFYSAFFIEAGHSLGMIAFFWFLYSSVRLLVRFVGVRLLQYFDIQNVLYGAIILRALAYLLPMIDMTGINVWIVSFYVVSALSDSMYWTLYHALYGQMGDSEHRGKQVAVSQAGGMVMMIFMPAVIGAISHHFGFEAVFLLTSVLTLSSLIPLSQITMPHTIHLLPARQGLRLKKDTFSLFIKASWIGACDMLLWPIIVFMIAADMQSFGVILSVGIALQVVLKLVFGHFIDKGFANKMQLVGGSVYVGQLLYQMFFVFTPWGVFVSYMLETAKKLLYDPAHESAYYNMLKKNKSSFWSAFLGEMGHDIGFIIAMSVFMIISFLQIDIRYGLLIGIIGIILQMLQLNRYYKEH